MGMPSEQDLVITAFLGQADEPEGVSTIEAQRYWHLAGNELGRIISSLGGTPLSATAAGEPALLCLGEHGAAIVTIRGNSFVVHRVRRGAGPISIRESGPMLAEFSERDCNIEIDVPGLPGPIVVSGLSQADLQGRRDAIFSALAD
jgi:hypothetical protein